MDVKVSRRNLGIDYSTGEQREDKPEYYEEIENENRIEE